MRTAPIIRALCLTLVPCVAGIASAGTVTLSDGSRIVGAIERLQDGKLLILTQFAGKLEIDVSQVTSIATDDRVVVALASGDRLVGTIEISADQEQPVVHTAMGPIAIPVDGLNAIWPEGEESPEVLAQQAELAASIAALKPHWSTKLEFGGVRSDGNTDTLTIVGRVDVSRKTEDDLLQFYLFGDYGEQNGVRSRNEYYGGIKYENSLTERWYWYARTELEYDEFENIDLRATAATGAGYYWLKKPDHEFKTAIGTGLRHEAYSNGETTSDAILDFGLDYRVDIKEWAQFTHSLIYSPNFESTNDYRLRLETALAFPLANSDVWKLKLGVKNEYNSMPRSGLERLDNLYYANIVLDIKK